MICHLSPLYNIPALKMSQGCVYIRPHHSSFFSIVTDEDLRGRNVLPSTCFTATCSLKNCPAIPIYNTTQYIQPVNFVMAKDVRASKRGTKPLHVGWTQSLQPLGQHTSFYWAKIPEPFLPLEVMLSASRSKMNAIHCNSKMSQLSRPSSPLEQLLYVPDEAFVQLKCKTTTICTYSAMWNAQHHYWLFEGVAISSYHLFSAMFCVHTVQHTCSTYTRNAGPIACIITAE